MRKAARFTVISVGLFVLGYSLFHWPGHDLVVFFILLFACGLYDVIQKKHTILRNFPDIGHFRYLLEMIAPEINQYFVESDTDGKPIDRNHRTYVYQRAKKQNETHPFGTELNVEDHNHKWMQHSIYPAAKHEKPLRVVVDGSRLP